MKVLLVGESTPLLRILQVVSTRAGFQAEIADSVTSLYELSHALQPDLLIFDHVHPMDLYQLNPRLVGFAGPLLVLTDSSNPEIVLNLLGTEQVLYKPFHLDAIVRRLRDLALLQSGSAVPAEY